MKVKEAKQIIESEFGDLRKENRSQYDTLVSLLVKYGAKADFTPIVAHVVIKNKEAENKLEQILNGNEFYIDYTQSFASYKAEQK